MLAEICSARGKAWLVRLRASGSRRSILFRTSSTGTSSAPISASTDCTAAIVSDEPLFAERRIDDVQDEVGDERLLQRRREPLHELRGGAAG